MRGYLYLPLLAALAVGCGQAPATSPAVRADLQEAPAVADDAAEQVPDEAGTYGLQATYDLARRGGGGGGHRGGGGGRGHGHGGGGGGHGHGHGHGHGGGGGHGHHHSSWWGGNNWWGSYGYRSWWGLGYQPAWWGTVPLVSSRFLYVNGYYYPYYSYGGYYYPSYSQPYLWSSGMYQPVTGTMPPPPNQGQPISQSTAQVYQAPTEQVVD